MKCGPSLTPDALLKLLDTLNPAREPGRITLISRFGDDKVEAGLPALVRAVQREGHTVVWSCDPMHGNIIKTNSGYKTGPSIASCAKCAASSPSTAPKARTPAASISR